MMDRSRDSRRTFISGSVVAGILIIVIFFGSPLAPYVRAMFAKLLPYPAPAADPLATVRYQSVLYALLADENAKLRAALHASPAPNATLVRVISRPPETLYDTILVDQGTSTGVHMGDLATYQGIALGKVVSAGAGTALIQLFSSSGSDEDVIIGKPSAIAVAHGVGGGAFELSVPQGVVVAAGDSVRIQNSETLLLAVVASVSSKPTDPSQTVRLRSPVSFADLDFVEIISASRP